MSKVEKLLKRALEILSPEHVDNLIHISPANRLRRRADEIEVQEKLVSEIKDYLTNTTNKEGK